MSALMPRPVLRAALAIWQCVRAADGRTGARGLLLGARKGDSVLIVWALDCDDAETKLAGLSRLMEVFDLTVIVADRWLEDWPPDDARDVVVLPDAAARAAGPAALDWDRWQARRLDQLRHDYAPDFEITLGEMPEPAARVPGQADQIVPKRRATQHPA